MMEITYRCTWDSGWTQYHDASDPMPVKWDSPPDEVIALVPKIDADAEIARLVSRLAEADALLREVRDTVNECMHDYGVRDGGSIVRRIDAHLNPTDTTEPT